MADDNEQKQATLVENTQSIDAKIDAKIQGVKNELRQISQLIETIKTGSRRTEETLRKEIETIKNKQEKIEHLSQTDDLKKTLEKLEPLLKGQKLESNVSTSTPLQQLFQQFTGQTSKHRGQIISPLIHSPASAIPSLLQGIMGSNLGNLNNIQNMFPSLLQGIVGSGKDNISSLLQGIIGSGHIRNLGGGNLGGLSGLGGLSNLKQGGISSLLQGFMGKTHVGQGFSINKSKQKQQEKETTSDILGQIATPVPKEKPTTGGYQELGKSSSIFPSATPKEKQAERKLTGKAGIIQTVTNELRAQGMTDNGISAILANMKDESNFDPTLRHADQPNFSGEAHYAHGLVQEGGDEWLKYEKWLKDKYPDAEWQDPKLQARFLGENLKENYTGLWNKLKTGTAEEGAQAFVSKYEKPAKQYELERIEKYSQGVTKLDSYGMQKQEILKAPSRAGEDPFTLKTGESRLRIVGNALQNGTNNDLIKAATEASKHLPEGWKVEAISGYREGSHGFHGSNNAVDFQLYDEKGIAQKNYQNPKTFRTYEKFAQDSHKYLSDINPELAKMHRWGGYFGGTLGSTYGAADLMHQDFGGKGFGYDPKTDDSRGMAAGSWAHGLKEGYKGYFDTPEDPSIGMMANKYQYSDYETMKKRMEAEAPKEKTQERLPPENQYGLAGLDLAQGLKKEEAKEKIEYTRLTPEGKEIDLTPKRQELTKSLDEKQQAILSNVMEMNKKDQSRLTSIPQEQTDLRPGQLKNFAMEDKIQAKAPIKPEPNLLEGQKKTNAVITPDNIKDIMRKQTPEYHESASVHPKWTDSHITPSKAGYSKVEKSYVVPSTGKDANFNTSSATASQ